MSGQNFPAEYYDDSYFSKMARGGYNYFKETRGEGISRGRAETFRKAKLAAGMRILDLGCGRGEFLMYCALHAGTESWGIDYSDTAIKLAMELRSLLDPSVQDRIHIIQEDATKLDRFEDAYFDRVFSQAAVEHLYDWQIERQFRGVYRVLKENGIFVIDTHPNKNYQTFGYPIVQLYKRAVYGKAVRLDGITLAREGGDINLQSPRSLSNHLRKRRFVYRVMVEPREQYEYSEGYGSIARVIAMFLERAFPFKYVFCEKIAGFAAKSSLSLRRFFNSSQGSENYA